MYTVRDPATATIHTNSTKTNTIGHVGNWMQRRHHRYYSGSESYDYFFSSLYPKMLVN